MVKLRVVDLRLASWEGESHISLEVCMLSDDDRCQDWMMVYYEGPL
jgi:hypothetical protein